MVNLRLMVMGLGLPVGDASGAGTGRLARKGNGVVQSRKIPMRLAAISALSLWVSGCAIPPIVTAASFAVDIVSLGETGKTVSDHGLSFVTQRDCALFRAFQGPVCQDPAPGDDTPQGALIALKPISDPGVKPAADDPMVLPRALAYLDRPLGFAATAKDQAPAAAFAASHLEPSTGEAKPLPGGLAYLAAGIGG